MRDILRAHKQVGSQTGVAVVPFGLAAQDAGAMAMLVTEWSLRLFESDRCGRGERGGVGLASRGHCV